MDCGGLLLLHLPGGVAATSVDLRAVSCLKSLAYTTATVTVLLMCFPPTPLHTFMVCFSAQGLPLRIADYMPAACHEHGIGSDMEVGSFHFKQNPVHDLGRTLNKLGFLWLRESRNTGLGQFIVVKWRDSLALSVQLLGRL